MQEPLLKKGFLVLLTLLFISHINFAQSEKQKHEITRKYRTEKLKQLSKQYAHQYNKQKQKAIQKAKQEGWIIRKEFKSGQVIELQGLTKEGNPLYFTTYNIDAANTISTDEVWSGGSAGLNLSGDGMTVGVWENGGVLTSHQEFTDQGTSRVTQVDSPSETHYHATHVAGTMIAAGVEPDAKGMAYEASLNAYEWSYDDSEMIDAALNGLLISNHSYGYITGWSQNTWYGDESISSEEDYRFGFYGENAAKWDSIAYELPYYLIAKAAGNDANDKYNGVGEASHPPDGGANGYDCIGWRGNAKNILTVGAVEDLPYTGYTGNPSDVSIASFSSRGPADDGRIKPDLCGNGKSLYSTFDDSSTAYNRISGTSMATPNIVGSLILLQEHWNETQGQYMKSATLKGLAIHTTNEAGDNDGPDYKFGWGLMNTKKAAEVISNRNISTMIEENTLGEGDTYSLNIDASGTEPFVITICWTDPAGTPTQPQLDPSTPMLVNDLDLQVTDGSTTYYPYKLDPQNPANAATTGDNDVDNVEKIVVNPASETTYTIEVSHEGALTDGPQNFSMIVSGRSIGYPQVQTDSVYNVTQTTAEADAEVTDGGSSTFTTRGFVYSKSGTPTTEDNVVTSNSGIGTYSASFSGLEPDTTYYVRAFATNSEGTNYGDAIEFTTDDYLPNVEPGSITNITTNSADAESEVTDNCGYSVTDRGFVYSTTTEPTLSDNVVQSGTGTGVFSSSLTSLTPGTKYFIRAYATNSQGTSYSEEQFFTTGCGILSELPYQQDFSVGMLPSCWENIDNAGSGQVWQFDNPGGLTINTTTAGNGFAILDSDNYGSGNSQDADLISSTFDLSAYDSVTLNFEHYYRDYNSSATLSYSTDGGSTWETIQTWSGSDTENPAIFEQNLTTEVAGQSNVKFKWNYAGTWGWYWAVDDIEITGVQVTPVASVSATPGCGANSGTVTVSSNMSGTQTFYLCDEIGTTLDSWTGDATSHDFTGLSDGNYTGKVDKNGNTSDLTSFVTLENSSGSPVQADSVNATVYNICESSSTRLSYYGGSGETFNWYAGACGDNFVGTGNELTVYPDSSTTYYGRWENACGVSACQSFTISVIHEPNQADTIIANNSSICEGETTELSYSGGSGNTFEWYTGSCGGTSAGSGNNLTVSPTETTTYYGRWEDSCGVTACNPVTIIVDPVPTEPSSVNASSSTICEGTNTRLYYSGGSGGSFEWYAGSCGGTHVGTGNDLTVTPTTSTTYYGRWESSCGASTCKSIEVTVNPMPDKPNSVSASSQSILEGESTELSYSGGSGDSFEWYSNSCGGTSVGSGNNLTVTPTETTTYYGRWENSCGVSNCDSVTIEVEQTVSAPTALNATEDTICDGASTRLSYTGGSGETFSWYTGSCGGTAVGTGNDITVTPTGTTTYYGRWENSYGVSDCKSITITVDYPVEEPRSAESSFSSICKGTTARLSYVGGTGRTFKWYKGTCGENLVGSGNDLTVAPIETTIYYGRWESACGASACDTAKIIVKDSTNITKQPEDKESPEGESVTFTVEATGTNLTYKWRKDDSELSDGNEYTGSSTPELTINPVSAEHGGTYDVVISGDCGVQTSNPATLTIGATAISDISGEQIQIYPNPTSGKLMVSGNDLKCAELTVLNLLGEQIVSKTINSDKEEIHLDGYPEGIYFIKINTKEARFTKKIIVE